MLVWCLCHLHLSKACCFEPSLVKYTRRNLVLQVETKLHEALAEDRQSWQRRAQQNNSKHSPNGPKVSPSKKGLSPIKG